jgi:hypothetical protein
MAAGRSRQTHKQANAQTTVRAAIVLSAEALAQVEARRYSRMRPAFLAGARLGAVASTSAAKISAPRLHELHVDKAALRVIIFAFAVCLGAAG